MLDGEVTAQAIAAANAAGKPVLVDPKSRSFLKYRGATVLTPNKHELQSAYGHECSTNEQVVAAARQILSRRASAAPWSPRAAAKACRSSRPTVALHIRTTATEVYDVTGAGNTAVAAMAVGLADGADIGDVARLANVAAGIVVGKQGTATATPDEILARLRNEEFRHGGKQLHAGAYRLLLSHWRRLGLRVAFTNGCFDMLHPGHVSLLSQARRSADRLVVGLNSDRSIKRLRGARPPIQDAGARAMVLSALKAVDAVVIFEEDTPLALITALEPDVLVIQRCACAEDQTGGKQSGGRRGPRRQGSIA